jgi:hypothetical protein
MMMTTAETAATDTILAIDSGKYKSVACHSRSIRDQRFVKFATSRAELTASASGFRESARLSGNTASSRVAARPSRWPRFSWHWLACCSRAGAGGCSAGRA